MDLTFFIIQLAASPLASRDFAPRGIITSSITYPAEKNANGSKIFAPTQQKNFSRLNNEFAKFA